MPPRSVPSERQKRLGAELRRMRNDAGESTDYAARLLGLDRAKISNMEAGVRAVTPERVRTLATNYGCNDEQYVEALVAMAKPRPKDWWETYRGQLPAGLLDITEMEWHASAVRAGAFLHAPGLLQTDGYVRAVGSAALPPLSEHEIELRVAMRMQRQQVLHRPTPISYIAYIHEAALRIEFGGMKVMRAQLHHLCEMSELRNVEVRVVPFSSGAFPGAGQALMYATGVVPQLDTVQLDSAHGPGFTHAPAQLDKYRAQLDWMQTVSFDPGKSRDFILTLANA
ncbi:MULTISPECIES: helix-turn-helix transcriptional regulator [unclassified Streptomyces]|uniref:helix-turn-helix domain-containing protein n=1 Tax=unclassified Streptomyces TaxID=2593676 RepID=UPI00081F36DF|nr:MULTISPECIES: helix-turn-helix transcriptional regulator [unclassified Streptomyces]MYR25863.1 helix-turn-helix domain-containing protein [Streptomyces sp. SID4945]SCE90140.1 Helix-turn-helix domain-containing protein [Streptomyces sp. LcepLS]